MEYGEDSLCSGSIIEILHYRGLPITDPAYQAALLESMQKNMYVLIFAATIVFFGFLLYTSVIPKSLVPTLTQFTRTCPEKNRTQRPFPLMRKKRSYDI